MTNILIHGLGQNSESWDSVMSELKENDMDVICPDLYALIQNTKKEYTDLADAFFTYCNKIDGKVNLCGLSLGGILTLDFAKKFPEKVNSIILIGTPYHIPKLLLKLQNGIFHIMPKSVFEKMGCSKKDFISLARSMRNLNIQDGLDQLDCRVLILCGDQDRINMKSAKLLNQKIKTSFFKTVKNSSHEVNVENPRELVKMIGEFWKECP